MKHSFINLFFASIFFISIGCQDKTKTIDYDIEYIKSIEAISPHAINIQIDNFAHVISLDFPSNSDITKVQIKFNLSSNVKLSNNSDNVVEFDLTNQNSFEIHYEGRTILFRIRLNLITLPINPTIFGWEKTNSFGDLPAYLDIYKQSGIVDGKNTNAYIAVSNLNDTEGRFAVLGEAQNTKTLSEFHDTSNQPPILLNAGYFWDGNSLGLMIRDGVTVNPAQPMAWRNYNGVSTVYYPTQGVFGLDVDGKFYAHWAYESNGKLYAYPSPSPNKAGEKPQDIPTDKFPIGAKQWMPKEAIGAGPVLIKNGEYKNFWENELFDASSGVGPTVNNPRSAIAYHPSGYLVFFVCEGRNQTPNTPGLTLKNVADILLEIGCTEAINLDGGGSSCMLINGKEAIKPSDGKQRSITNAVAIF